MIKLSEFRLGNLVYDEPEKEFRLIDKYDFGSSLSSGISNILHPVELDTEWLLRMGFVYLKNTGTLYIPKLPEWLITNISETLLPKWVVWHNHASWREWHIKLNHVHKLQNIYFEVAGGYEFNIDIQFPLPKPPIKK